MKKFLIGFVSVLFWVACVTLVTFTIVKMVIDKDFADGNVDSNTKLESVCLNGEVHNYENVEITNAPTCTEKGHAHQKCSVCGKERDVEFAVVEHTYNADGKCVNCDAVTDKIFTYTLAEQGEGSIKISANDGAKFGKEIFYNLQSAKISNGLKITIKNGETNKLLTGIKISAVINGEEVGQMVVGESHCLIGEFNVGDKMSIKISGLEDDLKSIMLSYVALNV